ncbi:MAG: hypothetical protein AB7Q01_16415 [Gammaproteobacteria bacterium]
MTLKLRIYNDDPRRVLLVTPCDFAGDPPEARPAGIECVLPGQSGTFHVHGLRDLHLREGEAVKPESVSPAEAEVLSDGARVHGDGAPVGDGIEDEAGTALPA